MPYQAVDPLQKLLARTFFRHTKDDVADPLHQFLKAEISSPSWSVLDLGCGIRPFAGLDFGNPSLHVDVYGEYLERIRDSRLTLKLNLKEDLSAYFVDDSYDVVLLLDIIEHLVKEDALKLIDRSKRIARRKVVIWTPNGFLKQSGDAWGFHGDFWQEHRSGFSIQELSYAGFTCKTIRVSKHAQHPEHDMIYAAYSKSA